MSSKLQIPGESIEQAVVPTGAPTGSAGADLTNYKGAMKPSRWLITCVVTVGPSDLTLYGCLARGVINDETDDQWGLFNDVYGNINAGVLQAAAPVGIHHFIVEDVGIFQRMAVSKSANTVTATFTPIAHSSSRGS